MKHWQVKASKMLLEDKWLRLRADSCVTADGKSIKPFYVLEYSPWVSVFALTDQHEVIIVRQYRHGLRSVTLELPSGGFEVGEDASLAGERELLEETGYRSEQLSEIARIAPNPASQTNFNHILFASNAKLVSNQSLDEGENIEVILMPVQQVIEELASGTFEAAIQTAAIFHGLNHMGVFSQAD